jgi:hypothetical protein
MRSCAAAPLSVPVSTTDSSVSQPSQFSMLAPLDPAKTQS